MTRRLIDYGDAAELLEAHDLDAGWALHPVIAVLTNRAADNAAQLRPGDQVGFRASSLE